MHSKSMELLFITIVGTLWNFSCSDDGGKEVFQSCLVQQTGGQQCAALTGEGGGETGTEFATLCNSLNGQLSEALCPSEGLLATCTTTSTQPPLLTMYFGYSPAELTPLAAACAGTWSYSPGHEPSDDRSQDPLPPVDTSDDPTPPSSPADTSDDQTPEPPIDTSADTSSDPALPMGSVMCVPLQLCRLDADEAALPVRLEIPTGSLDVSEDTVFIGLLGTTRTAFESLVVKAETDSSAEVLDLPSAAEDLAFLASIDVHLGQDGQYLFYRDEERVFRVSLAYEELEGLVPDSAMPAPALWLLDQDTAAVKNFLIDGWMAGGLLQDGDTYLTTLRAKEVSFEEERVVFDFLLKGNSKKLKLSIALLYGDRAKVSVVGKTYLEAPFALMLNSIEE